MNERDYQKDLEVCEKATEEPWEWRIKKEILVDKKDREFGFFVGDLEHPTGKGSAILIITTEENKYEVKDIICFKNEDKEFIALARTALPWYIKRCMDLESQLQQAEDGEAALREALGKWKLFAHFVKSPVDWRTGESLNDMFAECIQIGEKALIALSSPTQPSRYREALTVVEAAKHWRKCKECKPATLSITGGHVVALQMAEDDLINALTAYDKAGEVNGGEE